MTTGGPDGAQGGATSRDESLLLFVFWSSGKFQTQLVLDMAEQLSAVGVVKMAGASCALRRFHLINQVVYQM